MTDLTFAIGDRVRIIGRPASKDGRVVAFALGVPLPIVVEHPSGSQLNYAPEELEHIEITVTPDFPRHLERFWSTDLERLAFANPAALASMIARQRKALGLSLRGVGRLCNVSFVTVGDIERQKNDSMTGRSIREICDALALTADDLRAEIAAQHDEQEAA